MAGWWRRLLRPSQKPVYIVSGLPRSGTSLMMMMLEAGGIPPLTDAVRQPDEDNPKGYYEFERVKALPDGDTAWLDDAAGKAVKVIAALIPYLPEGRPYRILFMRRRMAEILASQRKMLLRRGATPAESDEADLARLFTRHLQEVESWLQGHPMAKRLDVNYNALLENPVPQIARINRFLGGFLNEQAMRQVIDPALYRNRVTSKRG